MKWEWEFPCINTVKTNFPSDLEVPTAAAIVLACLYIRRIHDKF